MILNALDEILFWNDIEKLKNKINDLDKKYYPDAPEDWYREKKKFIRQEIPNKKEFEKRLEYYTENGKPVWIASRNSSCDDLSFESIHKAITSSSSFEKGRELVEKHEAIYVKNPEFWSCYVNNVLFQPGNNVLELTIGAGLGTGIVMLKMKSKDLYMGVDIDFICAKHADALSKFFNVNGLGIATNMWNMPFDDNMFSSVCSSFGLDECREIPAILKEASRVLKPHGRMVLACREKEHSWHSHFEDYGFGDDEITYWLKKVRLYSDPDQIEDLADECGLSLIERRHEDIRGTILVFEKL